jgi:pheromone alpha factor receptor
VSCRGIISAVLQEIGGGIAIRFLDFNPDSDKAFALVIINQAFVLLAIYAAIMVTLILQVRVVFSHNKKSQKIATLLLSSAAFLFICLSIARNVVYIFSISSSFCDPIWLSKIILPFFIVFLGVCSLIFIRKLIFIIQQRKQLGIIGFGSLHILLIMSCQCLVIPSTSPLLLC